MRCYLQMIEESAYGIDDAGAMPWRLMVFEALQHSHLNQQFKVSSRTNPASSPARNRPACSQIPLGGMADRNVSPLQALDMLLMEAVNVVSDQDVVMEVNAFEGEGDRGRIGAGCHACLLQMSSARVADTLRSLLQVRRADGNIPNSLGNASLPLDVPIL